MTEGDTKKSREIVKNSVTNITHKHSKNPRACVLFFLGKLVLFLIATKVTVFQRLPRTLRFSFNSFKKFHIQFHVGGEDHLKLQPDIDKLLRVFFVTRLGSNVQPQLRAV